VLPDEESENGANRPDAADGNTLADRFFRGLDKLFDFGEGIYSRFHKVFDLLFDIFFD
jgi:hypothetical protein